MKSNFSKLKPKAAGLQVIYRVRSVAFRLVKYTVWIALLVLLCATSCSQSKEELRPLTVEYITYDLRGLSSSKVHIYESRNDSTYISERPDYWKRLSHKMGTRGIPPDNLLLMDNAVFHKNARVLALVEEYDVDSLRPEEYRNYYHQDAGLVVLDISVSQRFADLSQRPILGVCVIYDRKRDSVLFVDSVLYRPLSPETSNCISSTVIDSKGEYLYYKKGAFGFRFDIETGIIDTLPFGPMPIIPYNSSAILIYSEMDKKMRLLDSRMSVVSSINTDFTSTVSAWALDENNFVVGYRHLSRFRNFIVMRVSLYDFNKQEVTHLFDSEFGYILSASWD